MSTKHKIRRAKKRYLRALKRGDHETRNRAAGVLRQVWMGVGRTEVERSEG